MKRYLYKVKLVDSSYLSNVFTLNRILGIPFSTCRDIATLPLDVEVELCSRFGLKSEDPHLLITSDKTTDELIELCESRELFIKIKTL